MARAPGKQFEEDFKSSIPYHVYWYRLKDGTASWDKDENDKTTRFQASNDYDYFLFKSPILVQLELKSYNNTSYAVSSLRSNQISGLRRALKYKDSIPGILFNIRLINRTFFIHWSKLDSLIVEHGEKNKFVYKDMPRSSIPNQWIIENGIEVIAWKKKIHYAYDIRGLLDKLDNF